MRKSLKLALIALAAVVLIGVSIAALFLANQTSAPETTPPTTSAETKPEESAPAEADEPPQTYPVKVFFSRHPESDDDPGLTFPVQRTSPTSGVATFAISELLKGPTQSEAGRGYFSYVNLRPGESSCAGKDFRLSINDKTARLQFCRPFDHIGSVSDGQAESALKATLLQFDSIDKVIILNSRGDCEFDLAGGNQCLQ